MKDHIMCYPASLRRWRFNHSVQGHAKLPDFSMKKTSWQYMHICSNSCGAITMSHQGDGYHAYLFIHKASELAGCFVIHVKLPFSKEEMHSSTGRTKSQI